MGALCTLVFQQLFSPTGRANLPTFASPRGPQNQSDGPPTHRAEGLSRSGSAHSTVPTAAPIRCAYGSGKAAARESQTARRPARRAEGISRHCSAKAKDQRLKSWSERWMTCVGSAHRPDGRTRAARRRHNEAGSGWVGYDRGELPVGEGGSGPYGPGSGVSSSCRCGGSPGQALAKPPHASSGQRICSWGAFARSSTCPRGTP